MADAVVLVGGGPAAPHAVAGLSASGSGLSAPGTGTPAGGPAETRVIAADAGALLAAELGLVVHELVGDLDSLPADAVASLAASGTVVHRHPAAKDETDLELALGRAVAHGVRSVLVVGGDAGRLDHVLANALALAAPRWSALQIDAVFGRAVVHVVRDRRALVGDPGELVSLLAVGGPARGVETSGLLYPLRGEELHPGSSRGLSNELVEAAGSVVVAEGVVLVVRPGEVGTHVRDGLGPTGHRSPELA